MEAEMMRGRTGGMGRERKEDEKEERDSDGN